MPRRITLPLVAAVAASAVAASPAAAAPSSAPGDRTDRYVLPKHRVPEQAAPGGHTRDLLWRGPVPSPPTWPVAPEPLPRPAQPGPVEDGDGSWLLTGVGLVGAGIAAGGAAGIARRYRIRARRLAV